MTPERWRQIEEFFHRAVEFEGEEHTRILEEAERADPELRRDVELLLSSYQGVGTLLRHVVGGKAREAQSLLAQDSLSSPLEPPQFASAAQLLVDSTVTELVPGAQLGPYRILCLLGGGGTGEVYKARDTRLDRIVAIKRLKDQFRARFQREARIIAALNHTHICQIYDVGPDYLVLEYVEGHSLRGPIPARDARRLAQQIASALEEAHDRGVLHRDLKPANILVDNRGSAKLLDFGLAKLRSGSRSEDSLTIEGTVMGTAPYMSPEQVLGKPLDVRSDIFSFGAVVYELLSGHRAFSGSSTLEILNAVVNTEPVPLRESTQLAAIVTRCLRKDPTERFRSMAEILAALYQVSTEVCAEPPSIAVLPFANMSPSKDDEYFSDGLAEEILNLLAQIPELKVTARVSSFAFRSEKLDVRKIAETLGVGTILQGSLRHTGNRIRVAAQLINAADGFHLWSGRYDRELFDIFQIQDELAAVIVGALQVELAGRLRGSPSSKPTLPAYEAFLKGRHQYFKNTPDGVARAREYFEQAIALDPEYAEPHGGLGLSYFFLWGYGGRPANEILPVPR